MQGSKEMCDKPKAWCWIMHVKRKTSGGNVKVPISVIASELLCGTYLCLTKYGQLVLLLLDSARLGQHPRTQTRPAVAPPSLQNGGGTTETGLGRD